MELHPYKKEELKEIKRLYKTAFPLVERAPFYSLLKSARRGEGELLCIDENGFAGLAFLYCETGLALLAYFAIVEGRRGEGLGARALQMLRERHPDKRIAVEIECGAEGESDAVKLSRKNFYLRCGFEETGIVIRFNGVMMELLSLGGKLSFAEYRRLYVNKIGAPFTALMLRPLAIPEK